MTIANSSIGNVPTKENDSDRKNAMIDNDTLDNDTSHDDVTPIVNNTIFLFKDDFIEFIHVVDYVIDNEDIYIVDFLKQDT